MPHRQATKRYATLYDKRYDEKTAEDLSEVSV
jgi:hypothetical protein